MESLLRWGIENSTTDDGPKPPQEPRKDLDPGIIEAILGKPDAVLMKEALAIGIDDHLPTDARVIALDDLEMLVEQIDNANNLASLQMYPQILSLLSPQTPDEVRMQALWILGTAVQNNPKAQADFLKHDPLSTVLSILSPSTALGPQTGGAPSAQTRSKAAYALSASLKHNAAAVIKFGELGGWEVLRDGLQDSDITIRRKVAFLLNTLLLPSVAPSSSNAAPNIPPPGPTIHQAPPPTSTQSTVVAPHDESSSPAIPVLPSGTDPTSTSLLALKALTAHRIIPALIDSLVTPLPHGPDADGEEDTDYVEKAARTLITFLEVGGEFTPAEKTKLQTVVSQGSTTCEAWGLDQSEWGTLVRNVTGT